MKVYFEERGHGAHKGVEFATLRAYVNPRKDCNAYSFDADGKKYIWLWAHPYDARVYEHTQLPKDLWYSIRHGACYMEVPWSKRNNWDFFDLKYDKVDKEQVSAFRYIKRRIKNVNSIDDFKMLYPRIKKCKYFVPETVWKLCELCGVCEMPMINGELGIANLRQIEVYNGLLKTLGLEQ